MKNDLVLSEYAGNNKWGRKKDWKAIRLESGLLNNAFKKGDYRTKFIGRLFTKQHEEVRDESTGIPEKIVTGFLRCLQYQ